MVLISFQSSDVNALLSNPEMACIQIVAACQVKENKLAPVRIGGTMFQSKRANFEIFCYFKGVGKGELGKPPPDFNSCYFTAKER